MQPPSEVKPFSSKRQAGNLLIVSQPRYTWTIFLKESFGTVNAIFVLRILRLESDSDVQNT